MLLSEKMPLNVILTDITGKQLYQKQLSENINHQSTFDLSSFPNGTYVFQFEMNGKVFSKRVVLNR